MAISYSEFMKAQPVERFHVEEPQEKGFLNKILQRQSKDVDTSDERMERLKDMLRASKTGRQTLEFLEQKGAKLIFESMDYYGYFEPKENKVALNPAFSDEDCAVTFVHEVRHAWQDTQMIDNGLESTTNPTMTPKSFLVSGFFIEADACASEVTYAHEMREKNPKIWEAHQKSPYAPMSTEFEKTFKETGDVAQAREAALLKWFDLRVKKSYEDTYVEYMSEVANELRKEKEMEPQYFAEDRSTKTMIDLMGKDYDGNKFFTKTKALETEDKLFLTEKGANDLAKALAGYMVKYNRTSSDLGLDKITVVDEKGNKSTMKDAVEDVRLRGRHAKENQPILAALASQRSR